jgi:hypothetical protein
VKGHGERALTIADRAGAPRPALDHSHRTGPVPLTLSVRRPSRACDENPVSDLVRVPG